MSFLKKNLLSLLLRGVSSNIVGKIVKNVEYNRAATVSCLSFCLFFFHLTADIFNM